MDLDTEIASGFTVRRYWQIRSQLDTARPDLREWGEVVSFFRG
jgi:hypothetical protein